MPTKESFVIESLFRIADKEGNDVDFRLNSAQKKLDNELTGRDIVPKARQEGISAYYLARFLTKCLYKRNTRAVVISHESEATQRMLNRVKYYIENMKGDLRPETNSYSSNQLTFPRTNSMFYIGTAGAKKFGRGDTITDLHCSEAAFWTDPKSLLSGLFQAVPRTGEIGVESTGNGVGNWYHRTVMRAAAGASRFKLHFFDWQSFPEYSVPLTDAQADQLMASLKAEWEETAWKDEDGEWHEGVVEKYNLTPGQVAFRREKLEELDFDLRELKQEYPMTLEECFQATGRSLFSRINFVPTERWKRVSQQLWMLEGHPRKDRHYLIGGDVGAGTGGDNSVAQIVDLGTLEQVGEWVSNSLEPDVFGYKLAELGRTFNMAFITVESNNHGLVTIEALRDGKAGPGGEVIHHPYPTYLIYRKEKAARSKTPDTVDILAAFGFNTSRKSKPYLIGNLRRYLVKMMTIHSPLLLEELHSYIEHPDGSLGAEDGCLDDRVMALAVSIANVERTSMMMLPQKHVYVPRLEDDPFSLEGIMKGVKGRGTFLIPSHTL